MIAVRMDARVAVAVNPEVVLQQTFKEASQRLAEYIAQRPLPFFAWLRRIAWEHLMAIHNQHLSGEEGVAQDEPHADGTGSLSPLTSASIQFVSSDGRSSAGTYGRGIKAALGKLDPVDREILVLRHLERLSVDETGEVLGISLSETQRRHLLAVQRLHHLLQDAGGGDA
jgi:RNA polymerase sigma-70 factor (ECF subfamily)